MGRPRSVATHCKHGHEFTPENTYIHPRGGYRRSCRRCRTLQANARNAVKYRNDPKYKKECLARSMASYGKKTPEERRRHANESREKIKRKVYTHYGKHGKMQCCWKGCTICDIDMLSIDHIKDDGAEHRRQMSGNRVAFSGKVLYQWLISQGFPEGFQTLCMNHQVKKQRIKSRAERLDQ